MAHLKVMFGLLNLMNKYITFREGDTDAEYFILQREYPSIVCKICNTVTEDDWCVEQIDGYNLYLVYAGVLEGRYIPSTFSIEEIKSILRGMSLWYLSNRISKYEKKYKKFKEYAFSNQSGNS